MSASSFSRYGVCIPMISGAIIAAIGDGLLYFAGGAIGVALFGALAVGVGGAAAVLALKEAAMISVILLVFSAALACRVRPEMPTLPPVTTARSS